MVRDPPPEDPDDDDWVTFPIGRMPAQAAKVVEQAIDQMLEAGDASHRWQALEFMAASFIAGP